MRSQNGEQPQFTLASLRIIVISIAASTVLICMVFLGMRGVDPDDSMLLALTMAAMSFPTSVAAFVVPGLVANRKIEQLAQAHAQSESESGQDDDELDEPLLQTFGIRIVIMLAMIEGGAILNAMGFFLEGHLFSLILAAVGAGLCVAQFPTQSGYDTWRERAKMTIQNSNLQR